MQLLNDNKAKKKAIFFKSQSDGGAVKKKGIPLGWKPFPFISIPLWLPLFVLPPRLLTGQS
jgi:hypothetical protein